MKTDKVPVWIQIDVHLERRCFTRRERGWWARFAWPPHGYFHGRAATPAAALRQAWRALLERVPEKEAFQICTARWR